MKLKKSLLTILLITVLVIGTFGGASADIMGEVEDHLEYSLSSCMVELLPGSSDDPDDAEARISFTMRFINGDAPDGDVEAIECNFTFHPDSLEFVQAEVGPDWSSGDITCNIYDYGVRKRVSITLDGMTRVASTNWWTCAYIYFRLKCLPKGTQTLLDLVADQNNRCLVEYDIGGTDHYLADPKNDGSIIVSYYTTTFYLDHEDGAVGFMGTEVNVPIQFQQAGEVHRLDTVGLKIGFDNSKLEYKGVTVNGSAFESGNGSIVVNPTSSPIVVRIKDASGGYIKQPSSTSEIVKLCDLRFEIKGHAGGPGSSIPLSFVDNDCDHTVWTQWNEGAGNGCQALNNSLTTGVDDQGSDVDIPEYTAAMEIKPVDPNTPYSRGDGTIDFYVSLENNFPIVKDAAGNGEINTLHDRPGFMTYSSVTGLGGLTFGGAGPSDAEDTVFAAWLQVGSAQYPSGANIYEVTFGVIDNNYTADWNDRTIELSWLASASIDPYTYETFLKDQTGYVELEYGDPDLTLNTTPIDVHTGLFTSPYCTDEDITVNQPVYIKSTFDVGQFSVDVSCDNNGWILTVIPEDGVSAVIHDPWNATIYYDGGDKFCDATGDNDSVLIATVGYKVICPPAKALKSSNIMGPSGYVTSAISFDNGEMENYPSGDAQFVDLDPHNIKVKCWLPRPDREDRSNTVGALPTEFALHSNRPNPFNPAAIIAYDVPAASRVTIDVINILGRRVATLVDEEKAPGRYETVWNGTDENGIRVSSGIYLYRMQAGDFIQTKKMMLMK